MTVFVGYATVNGSTRQIAERIAARLLADGVTAEVGGIDALRPNYEAYVLGSAVHNQAWLPAASDALARHRAELNGRRVWLFSVGMPAAMRGPWKRFALKEEARLSAQLRRSVRPEGHRLFNGVFLPEHADRAGRIMFRAMGMKFGDYRDLDAEDAWADEIADRLTGTPESQRDTAEHRPHG
jgi:menaquinone-dependent protoporphyrinogen oxidase